ncbi:MAG: class I SAM-dependent RNA methyltransferase [Thermodesulfobacteriota bacterium]
MKDLKQNNSIPKNLNIEIEKLVYGGEGLARTEFGVLLVPNTVPGETILVSSIHKRRGVFHGRLQDIFKPSEHRVPPFCDNFAKGCGGCQWQHIDYLEQVEIKRRIIEETLERIGKKTVKFPPLVFDLCFKGTRLRSLFHICHKKSEIGFYRFNTNDIIPIKECPLCVSSINHALSTIHENYDMLKSADSASIITNGNNVQLYLEGVKGSPLYFGPQYIEFLTGGFKYLANAKVFFQGHSTLNGKLIQIINDLVGEKRGELLLDLFCGVGFLSIPVSSHFNHVVGIDNQQESIQLAKENAKLNRLTNMEFYRQDLGLKNCLSGITSVDAVIIDPPRSGCPKILIEELARLNPPQIIMVSCNPATMARDIRMLMNNGYEIVSGYGIDIFPQTFHVETIVSLIKK